MKLFELFSPIGAPKEADQDIDWIGDLKFYILLLNVIKNIKATQMRIKFISNLLKNV
jgi:hypothetical protein